MRPGEPDAKHAIFAIYWTCAEVSLAIICPCAITLKPLVSKVAPAILGTLSNSRGGRGHSTVDTPTFRSSSKRIDPDRSWAMLQESTSAERLSNDGSGSEVFVLQPVRIKEPRAAAWSQGRGGEDGGI